MQAGVPNDESGQAFKVFETSFQKNNSKGGLSPFSYLYIFIFIYDVNVYDQ